MIIIGEGALFSKALEFCARVGAPVDGVISPTATPERLLNLLGCRIQLTRDPNDELDFIQSHNRDGIVWSLNNRFLLREHLLGAPGLEFFNIHNGLVERCRGVSEISVFFALLDGSTHYGATLHRIDSGIDTGPAIAQERFSVSEQDAFRTLMTRSLATCLELFQDHCMAILHREFSYLDLDRSRSKQYSYKTLPEALRFRSGPSWRRAEDLGPYRAFFPRLAQWLDENSTDFDAEDSTSPRVAVSKA